MAIEPPETWSSPWPGTTDKDYRLVDFDPGAFEGTTESMTDDGYIASASVLGSLLSSVLPPQTNTWSSLLVTTLTENLTALTTNGTDLLAATVNFNRDEMTDGLALHGRCDYGSEMFNCTVQEYMEYMRGPQMLPVQQAIFVSRSLDSN